MNDEKKPTIMDEVGEPIDQNESPAPGLDMEVTEGPADEVERDYKAEVEAMGAYVDNLKDEVLQKDHLISQLQDAARMNVASKVLPYYLDLFSGSSKSAGGNKKKAVAAAIALGDDFVTHYEEIMEKNVRDYMAKSKEIEAERREVRKEIEAERREARKELAAAAGGEEETVQ